MLGVLLGGTSGLQVIRPVVKRLRGPCTTTENAFFGTAESHTCSSTSQTV